MTWITQFISHVFESVAVAKPTSDDPAASAVETTQKVSQHFAEISKTDPWAAFCFILGLSSILLILISFVSPRFKSKVPSLASMGGRFVLLMFGGFFLMLPIAMHLPTNDGSSLMWPYLYQSIPAAFFLMFNTLGFSANLVLWTPVIHVIMGYSVLANLYFWLIVFYIVASPIMLALTAVDVIVNGITGISITVLSWIKAICKRPVYVFCGADQNTLILAKNLLAHLSETRSRTKPLIIFSDGIDTADPRIKMLLQEVKTRSYSVASFVSTPLSATAIPSHLAHWSHRRSITTFFAIQEDAERNLLTAEALLDDTLAQMKRFENKHGSKKRSAHGFSKKTTRYARHIKIWCRADAEHDFSLKYDESKKRLFGLVEVNILNSQRDAIWDCFATHPITDVLRSIDISAKRAPAQELTVLVSTCDSAGLAAVRTASWFSVLPGVKVNFVAAATDPQKALMQLAEVAPEMLLHMQLAMIDTSLSQEALYAFCRGESVDAYTYHAGKIESIKIALTKHANLYMLVVNAEQEGSFPTALHAMRAAETRMFALKESGAKLHHLPKALIMVQTGKQARDIMLEPKDDTESSALVQMKTFGAKEDQLSYKKIIEGKAVKSALRVKRKISQEVSANGLPTHVHAEPLSMQKAALLSTVYFVPSLLWCLGIDAAYRTKLAPAVRTYRKKLFSATHVNTAFLTTRTFQNTALTTAGVQARQKQLKAHEAELKQTVPTLLALANIERERMAAYLRAEGWTTGPEDLQELLDLNHFFGVDGAGKTGFPNPNIAQIKQDYLLVDSLQAYYKRSAAAGCDSPAYDRARMVYAIEAFLCE